MIQAHAFESIGDRSVASLATEFGTPFLALDLPALQSRLATLASADRVRHCVTDSDSVAVLGFLRSADAVVAVDCASGIDRSLEAGFSPSPDGQALRYSADLFDKPSLAAVLKHGLNVACGSTEMVGQIGDRRPGCNVTLTVNSGIGTLPGRGIWKELVGESLLIADQNGVTVTGLHFPAPQPRVDRETSPPIEVLAQHVQAAEKIAIEVGRTLMSVSTGIPFGATDGEVRQFLDLWQATKARLASQFGHPLELEAEPDTWLIDRCRFRVAEIGSIKKFDGRTIIGVNVESSEIPESVLIATGAGNASERQSIEATIVGRRATAKAGPTIQMPAVRVGDFVLWPV